MHIFLAVRFINVYIFTVGLLKNSLKKRKSMEHKQNSATRKVCVFFATKIANVNI